MIKKYFWQWVGEREAIGIKFVDTELDRWGYCRINLGEAGMSFQIMDNAFWGLKYSLFLSCL